MFEIKFADDGQILLKGRFDASQIDTAKRFLSEVREARVVDLKHLEYISSAGLGVLLATQKRLAASGAGLTLVNVSNHIRDVFRYAGFDQIFRVED